VYDNDASNFTDRTESGGKEEWLKKMNLQTTAENSQGRCRRDVAWQFVPDTAAYLNYNRILK